MVSIRVTEVNTGGSADEVVNRSSDDENLGDSTVVLHQTDERSGPEEASKQSRDNLMEEMISFKAVSKDVTKEVAAGAERKNFQTDIFHQQ